MTDKQIIDDVDVSECEYHRDTHKELLADGNIKIFANYCQINNDGCYAINCYYKQLKRKEQECERWEEINKYSQDKLLEQVKVVCKLKQTLTEIKEIAQYDVYTSSTDLCLKLNWIKKKISEVEDVSSNS